jgi:hypothetical protein
MFKALAIDLLQRIVSAASPLLVDALQRAVDELQELAESTENEYDDLLVNVLVDVLEADPDPEAKALGEATGKASVNENE